MRIKNILILLLLVCVLCGCNKESSQTTTNKTSTTSVNTTANNSKNNSTSSQKATTTATDDNIFYFGASAVNAGKDTGYSESNSITLKDPHYGWSLGRFYIKGFTQRLNKNGTEVLLKTVGDTLTLGFELQQDIDSLNGNKKLSISGDTNGFDKELQIEKTDFGRGVLFITKTDYQNNREPTLIYTNYLEGVNDGSLLEIELNEEGDYEIVLDYEIKEKKFPGYKYYNYRIKYSFSVRNGNCMVFAFDITTHSELVNKSYTSDGFKLDLANSRYLSITVKREVLNDLGGDILHEDTRFNRPARDGEEYTEEGIYTVIVKNQYTEEETQKKIYVGEDGVLKAHVMTGMSIPEIRKEVNEGNARILPNGTLKYNETTENNATTSTYDNSEVNTTTANIENNSSNGEIVLKIVGAVFVTLTLCGVVIFAKKKK